MRYHHQAPSIYLGLYGRRYICDHPVYNSCTLFEIGEKGLAVSEIDPWLTDELYLHPGFKEFFDLRANKPKDGLYPTVTIRQIMWALKLKPLPKAKWETVFDRKEV